MSVEVSEDSLKQAIVQSVQSGAYPRSEDVSSAELPPSLLPELLIDLETARNEVKTEIRQRSKGVSPDVDGWIAQAKKLQADIQKSKATAREIVQQAEAGRKIKDDAKELASKADLLEKEVAFNGVLVDMLSRMRSIRDTLDATQLDMVRGDLLAALTKIKDVDDAMPGLADVENTRAHDLLRMRTDNIKSALAEQAIASTKSMISADRDQHSLKVSGTSATITDLVNILTHLGALTDYVKHLRLGIEAAVLEPRLATGPDSHINYVIVEDDTLRASSTGEPGCLATLNDIWTILSFVASHVPTSISMPLAESLMPPLIERLTSTWLNPFVPANIQDMPFFQEVLNRVSELAEQVDSIEWPGSATLREWVQSAPRTWLAKRRETALGSVRSLMFTGLMQRKTVERVETQMVSKHDFMGAAGEQDEDAWDAAWEEDEDKEEKVAASSEGNAEDEDASAWAFDDSDTHASAGEAGSGDGDGDGEDDAEAWGWGDDEASSPGKAPSAGQDQKRVNGSSPVKASSEREMTLKESYTVTAIPQGLLETITQVISDAETLADPSYGQTPIGPASSALYTLPTLVLAMYRATASIAYEKLDIGNMLIYNDSLRLADQLRGLVEKQRAKDSTSSLPARLLPSSRLKLDNDIQALESFAKRAYAKEMDSQRTILRDMLDGAQGFANCTVEPFASACSDAITITVDRLRDVHRQWEAVLSRSALLQTTGSLLGTVTSKMITEIEELSDIGDDESKKLRALCDKVFEIKELFAQEQHEGGVAGDTTGIYCPNWFKFQYLAEILESSLADIKYLWTEGELRLEFGADEVTDLIQALFADSDHRRRAMAEIGRGSRGGWR